MVITKKQSMRRHIEMHRRSDIHELHELYNSYSIAKHRAFEYCKVLCEQYNGYDLKILGGNCFSFSVGFYGKYNGKDAFFYITREYDRVCYI